MSLRQDIKAYLDGELNGDQALQVAQLLQSDAELRKEADDFRALSSTFRLVAEPEAIPHGLNETLRALESGPKKRHAKPWWQSGWGLALTGATVILIAVILLPVGSQSRNAAQFAALQHETAAVSATTNAGAISAAPPVPQAAPPMAMAKAMAPPVEEMARKSFKAPEAGGRQLQSGAMAAAPVSSSKRAMASPAHAGLMTPTRVPTASLAAPNIAAPSASRLVIQDGNVSIYVTDIAVAQNRVEGLAKSFGGFVSSSTFNDGGAPESRLATVEIRIPVSRFQEAVAAVRGLGEVYQQQLGGNDVTAQVADSEGRLKALHAEADQLRELVHKAKNVDEVLQVRDRLNEVEQEIEGLDSQRTALRDQAAMSTLTVTLALKPKPHVPPPPPAEAPPSWLGDTVQDATSTFKSVLLMIVGLFAKLIALSPIWIPVLLLSYWGWKASDNKRGY